MFYLTSFYYQYVIIIADIWWKEPFTNCVGLTNSLCQFQHLFPLALSVIMGYFQKGCNEKLIVVVQVT